MKGGTETERVLGQGLIRGRGRGRKGEGLARGELSLLREGGTEQQGTSAEVKERQRGRLG